VLRIVAGEFGSRRIATPSGTSTRPTSDRVREALFSMLGDVSGDRVLDLFAGSGALGIEAISRGADSATFVDRAAEATKCVSANLDLLGLKCPVLKLDWKLALGSLARDGEQFDVVFVDPPYAEADAVAAQLPDLLGGILAPDALVVFESGTNIEPMAGMTIRRERRHGATLLRLYGN